LALAMNLAQGRDAAVLPGWRRHPTEISGIELPACPWGQYESWCSDGNGGCVRLTMNH
jgi:hypothetical protein